MSLPNFQQLMLPTLHYLCQRFEDVHISRLEEDLGKALKLTTEDLARVLPSGQQSVFANRLNWARAYLSKACLVESPRRGYEFVTRKISSGVAAIAAMPKNMHSIDA